MVKEKVVGNLGNDNVNAASNNRVGVRGHKYVVGPVRVKLNSEKGQQRIYAQEHQVYCYYNNFRWHSEKELKTVQ